MEIHVTFDGEDVVLGAPATVADLLVHLELSSPILSVALNGKVISRFLYGECELRDGDELTAVVQVGGG